MASDGVRLYVTGGDWTHSATDGTWSMNLTDGTWRQDHAGPVYPSVPAPHALQDGAGFEWDAKRGDFIVWPGAYYPYPPPVNPAAHPLHNFSSGFWRFDGKTFTHDMRLFAKAYESTGCLHGGVYESPYVIAFADDSAGLAVRRWDMVVGLRLKDGPLPLKRDPAMPGMYFARSRYTTVGRWVYVLGYRTDGIAKRAPLFFRYSLDIGVVQELPAPSVATMPDDLETRLATSNGKVVWPRTFGPEGDIDGVHVYDPAKNVWSVDRQVPVAGNFICNSVCSLLDGRAVFAGGVFGKPQTHIWFYKAGA